MQAMFEAVLSGATDPEIEGVEVVRRAALAVSPTDVLEADGYLLGSPGEPRVPQRRPQTRVRYVLLPVPRLDPRAGRSGCTCTATRAPKEPSAAVDSITTGLGWVKAAEYVLVSGKPSKDDLEACWEFGATVAAGLMEG